MKYPSIVFLQMDLHCGVLDLKSEDAVQAAARAAQSVHVQSQGQLDSTSDEESDDDANRSKKIEEI